MQNDPNQSAEDKDLIQRIQAARADRSIHEGVLNNFYDLAMPHRRHITSKPSKTSPRRLDEQDDLFDDTLQQELIEFASMMQDAFTPNYRPWARLKASAAVPKAQKKKIDAAILAQEKLIYEEIGRSNFYEESQQVWLDLGGSAGAMNIPYARTGPVDCTKVVMSALLMDVGPKEKMDGRWHEFMTEHRHLRTLFPSLKSKLDKIPKFQDLKGRTKVLVTQGCHKVGEKYQFCIVLDETTVLHRSSKLPSSTMPVLRWQDGVNSAWGQGPALTCMASANKLQEVEYLLLKGFGRAIDPPWAYTEDGLLNFEAGIGAGDYIPMAAGSTFQELSPSRDFNQIQVDRDRYINNIKRALYQDSPEQAGKTPPTASQWLDERAQNDRRLQLARLRIYKEWVLPVLQRFQYILERRGKIKPIEIDGEAITVEFQNPAARASDSEDVSRGVQMLQTFAGIFGEQFMANIDAPTTMSNLNTKMGTDELVIIKPFDQQDDATRELLQNMRNLSNEA